MPEELPDGGYSDIITTSIEPSSFDRSTPADATGDEPKHPLVGYGWWRKRSLLLVMRRAFSGPHTPSEGTERTNGHMR
ncbi:MAG: hypothetical protein QHG99_05800 [Methanomicrobiales archaeon]|nr:hypothetical protein [Methanomicrobiales archaeon]